MESANKPRIISDGSHHLPKSAQVKLSVFASEVFYIVQSLAAFQAASYVVLLMFAQMFYIAYAETVYCACSDRILKV